MANKIILADTSILIDYFRKTDKTNSALVKLYDQGYNLTISAITHYEIYSGTTVAQFAFWQALLDKIKVVPFDVAVAQQAVDINNSLKQKSKQIAMADLFIAATAISNNLLFSTLNKKHFNRINGLNMIE